MMQMCNMVKIALGKSAWPADCDMRNVLNRPTVGNGTEGERGPFLSNFFVCFSVRSH